MNFKPIFYYLIILLIFYSISHAEAEQACGSINSLLIDESGIEFNFAPKLAQQIITSPPAGPSLHLPDTTWVENTLAGMTLDEKIGQMIIVWYSSTATGYSQISSYHVGGFIFSQWSAQQVFNAVWALQTASRNPLWFVADFEAGTGARIKDGTTFPLNMAHGAADDTALAENCGRITAREARAMGIPKLDSDR